jgi:hypothetical protein
VGRALPFLALAVAACGLPSYSGTCSCYAVDWGGRNPDTCTDYFWFDPAQVGGLKDNCTLGGKSPCKWKTSPCDQQKAIGRCSGSDARGDEIDTWYGGTSYDLAAAEQACKQAHGTFGARP